MLGYPGAGKTTTSKIIHELTGAVHLNSDEIRFELFPRPQFTEEEHAVLYKAIDRRTEDLLRAGSDVIYDANLNRYEHRQEKYDICDVIGAEAVLMWVQAPKDIAKERAGHDSRRHLWPSNEAPDEMFERIVGVIDRPRDNERYIAVDGTKVTPAYIKSLLNDYETAPN